MDTNNTKKRLMVVLVILIGLIAAGSLIYMRVHKGKSTSSKTTKTVGQQKQEEINKDPQKVAEKFIIALTQVDATTALEYGSDSFRSSNTKAQVVAIGKSLETDDPKFSNEEVYHGSDNTTDRAFYLGDVANLPANSAGSTTGSFILRLVYEGNGWKVDSSRAN